MPMMNEDMPRQMGEMESDSEQSSVFLPKTALGGRECKPGEILSLKVVDIDPETGDVEAVLQGYDEGRGGAGEDYETAFDRAMPEESED